MKKLALAVAAFTFSMALNAQQPGHNEHDGHNHGTKPVIAEVVKGAEDALLVKELEHDFAKIPQGKPVYYSFTVTNNGKTPLKLENVQASCGCTTPEWSREAIPAGASAPIKVGYNAAAEGYFDKSITITYNTNQTKVLHIKGTVWKAPEGSAPANASADFLKKQSF